MLYFVRTSNGTVVNVVDAVDDEVRKHAIVQSRWDWKSFEEVQFLAEEATKITGQVHLPVDSGESVFPRFDVIVAPKVGDKVSYAFNGDYYPDGVITKITKGWKISTSGGHEYRRRKNTGRWVQPGGTWSLVQGHRSELNPSF